MAQPKTLASAPRTGVSSTYSADSRLVIHAGDNLDLLADVPDGTVKLVVTSPPYNLGKQYERRVEIERYLDTQRKTISELHRVLTPDGSICWQVGNYVEDGEIYPLDIYYYDIFKDLGMRLRNRIVWHFGHGLHARQRFSGRYETILWFTKGNEYTFNLDEVRVPAKYPGKRSYKGPNKGKPSGNPKGKNPSDFWAALKDDWDRGTWDIPNCKSNHPEKTEHPAQFPIELVERCVLALSNEDEWVLDPYAGVGSSLLAALRHNRRAMGSEKEEAYLSVTQSRLEALFKGELPVRQLGTPVWKPSGSVAEVPEEWTRSAKNGKKTNAH